jgi:DNA mismatch endonuclease, patch repair protein
VGGIMDNLTKNQRSHIMSSIKSKNTQPEIALRKELSRLGLEGYRIKSILPGKPDVVFPKYKLVIFLDGCFWHKCPKCFVMPKSNQRFWRDKIRRNVLRDNKVNKTLRKQGYHIIRIREHDARKNIQLCAGRIRKYILKRV